MEQDGDFLFHLLAHAAVSAGAEKRLRCVDLFTQEGEKISSGYLSVSAVRKLEIIQELRKFIICLKLNISCFSAVAWDNGLITTNIN